MKKTILTLSGLLIALFCMLVYSSYKCYSYKSQCANMQQEVIKRNSRARVLNCVDCMVLSEDPEAYLKCNSMRSRYIGEYGDSVLTFRDYILYCYIFAIRDGNACAATEFSTLYLNGLNDGSMPYDTLMLRVAVKLLKQAQSISFNSPDKFYKWLSALYLRDIYGGKYGEALKDSLLYLQYADTVIKY